jgi:hypothetical protein
MVSEVQNSLTEYVPGQIWLKEYPIRYAGCRFNARMTIVRLSDGRLLIYSPSPIDARTKTEIEVLGPMAFIIAPGNFHYLNVNSSQDGFPDAKTYICPGIEKKSPNISYTQILGDKPDPAWGKKLDQVLVAGGAVYPGGRFFLPGKQDPGPG